MFIAAVSLVEPRNSKRYPLLCRGRPHLELAKLAAEMRAAFTREYFSEFMTWSDTQRSNGGGGAQTYYKVVELKVQALR